MTSYLQRRRSEGLYLNTHRAVILMNREKKSSSFKKEYEHVLLSQLLLGDPYHGLEFVYPWSVHNISSYILVSLSHFPSEQFSRTMSVFSSFLSSSFKLFHLRWQIQLTATAHSPLVYFIPIFTFPLRLKNRLLPNIYVWFLLSTPPTST